MVEQLIHVMGDESAQCTPACSLPVCVWVQDELCFPLTPTGLGPLPWNLSLNTNAEVISEVLSSVDAIGAPCSFLSALEQAPIRYHIGIVRT